MAYAEGGPYLGTLNETLKFVSSVYGLARDEGVVAVRFFNSRKGKRDVRRTIQNILERHDCEGTARIGTELKKKIIDKFVSSERGKMKKPLLVVTITNGTVRAQKYCCFLSFLRTKVMV